MRVLAVRWCLSVSLVTLALTATPVAAGTTGRWDRFAPQTQASTDEPALHRTADGRLHVVWPHRSAQGDRLLHRAISRTGDVGALSTIVEDWTTLSNPDVVADGDGMRVFFGGQRSTDAEDQYRDMSSATAPVSGSPWALEEGQVTGEDFVHAGAIGATLAADGTPFQTWSASTGVFVHRGMTPGTNHNYQDQLGSPCCSYNPDLAVEGSTGRMWVAWYTDTDPHIGVYVNEVNTATGAPLGSAQRMPGSAVSFDGEDQSTNPLARAAIVGRPGRAGVFVAFSGGYPGTKNIRVWRVGASTSPIVARMDRVDDATLAVDPRGRMWVLWSRKTADGTPRIYGRRSNPAVTRWGRKVSVLAPGDNVEIYKLAGNAQPRRVDVVALFATVSETSLWHRQLKPALSLSAQPQRFRGRERVKFTVRDAGVPVANARVTAAGRSERTNSNGVARIRVGPYRDTRRVPAVATKAGFVRHRIVLRVRPE